MRVLRTAVYPERFLHPVEWDCAWFGLCCLSGACCHHNELT